MVRDSSAVAVGVLYFSVTTTTRQLKRRKATQRNVDGRYLWGHATQTKRTEMKCAIAVCSFSLVRPAHRRAAPICASASGASTISPSSAETAEEQDLGTLQSGKFKTDEVCLPGSSAPHARFLTVYVTSVSRISVCGGELCQCQGDFEWGGASDHAIETLNSLNLPFDVDEVGCLGACGRGTMIAVDFCNGDSFVLDGLESTLTELGLQKKNELFGGEQASKKPSIDLVSAIREVEGVNRQRARSPSTSGAPSATVDVRERMRQEAAEEAQNPWMNMASYLFKKAIGSDDR
ncbi:hypothetical protein THAOC_28601 [Thalassiosira oceanica]|uniref:Uncharacterized protein n=1 Tax=Thalassiosira oceanica TaxID=159749 RepID=K0REN3_THAOC|nr:hypothetical protein THAOC_28601 [Thalassiosira oceanica]|eukprot:EJK52163.1 hypothetical protein THAOC_28601 [Thalassiosira oceanica]